MPDDVELRVQLARVEGRVDALERIVVDVGATRDAQVRLESKVENLAEDVHEAHDGVRRVEGQIQEEARKREQGQADRLKTEQTTRTMVKVAAIGLVGTFITSGGLVLVAVLNGGGS